MIHTRGIGKLIFTLGIGITILTGNLVFNTSTAFGAAPPSQVYIEDPEYLETLRSILRLTPSGNDALQVARDHAIGVKFHDDSGRMFIPALGYIVLDRTVSPIEASLHFVHEMTHALNYAQGTTGETYHSTRDAFVRDMLWDEVSAIAKEIYAKMELRDKNADGGRIFVALERVYWRAYREGIGNVLALDGWDWEADIMDQITDAESEVIGREVGLKRLFAAFEDGEVVSSVNGETYPSYYGRIWDSVH